MQTPTLDRSRFSKDAWTLSVSSADDSYELQIRCYHGDETFNHYKFVKWEIGEEIELVSQDDFMSQYAAILEHEGEEVADDWLDKSKNVRQFACFEEKLMKQLIARWEAMLTLDLFTPAINI
jgi:hypothetical protein